jgi:transposase
MTQQERDRLVALKKAKKGLITQRQAAEELGQSERHIRRLLVKLRSEGDRAVIHALRGRRSNRKVAEKTRAEAVAILSRKVYHGFGPTLAGEYLGKQHGIAVSRETVRAWMTEARLWRPKEQAPGTVHIWRERRARCGEMVQWDTSEHDWLEGRGPKLYLISMIDDASSRVHARFVLHDSTEENMRLLWSYLELHGRPLSFYTDKASLFQTAPKVARDITALPRDERDPLPPTQIGRALAELGIVWIAAHSPQAKGRIERSFQTDQDRLVKGLRVAGVKTLAQANSYLEKEFIPWWNQTLTVVPASADDAHRLLGKEHSLAASLSYVEPRQVSQRLYDPVRCKDLADRAKRYSRWVARSRRAGGDTAGWIVVGVLQKALSESDRMSAEAQSGRHGAGPKAEAFRPTREKPMDEEFPPDRPGKDGVVCHPCIPLPRRRKHSEGRAKTARSTSRLIYPKTAAPKLHQSSRIPKNQNPQNGQHWARFDWGIGAICFGASPVAAVFGSAPGSATSPKHRFHFKPAPQNPPSKQDISTLRAIGHFYLALTGRRIYSR